MENKNNERDFFDDYVDNFDYEKIGIKIKNLRKTLKLTQQQLADKIFKTESSIRKYEKGLVTIPINVLIDLAKALDTPIYELLEIDAHELSNKAYTYDVFGDFYIDEKEKKEGETYSEIIKASDTNESLSKIKEYLDILNYKGKVKAVESVELLTKVPEYQKDYFD